MNHPWNLQDRLATLSGEEFSCRIDLNHPARGLHQISVQQQSIPEMQLFCISSRATGPADFACPIEDTFIREADLFVQYGQTAETPFSSSVYYRGVPGREGSDRITAVRLVASVQTDLLDSRPELYSRTYCPAAEVLQLVAGDPPRWRALDLETDFPISLGDEAAPYCILVRMPGLPVACSYVEMVHPDDFQGAEISITGTPRTPLLELTTPLLKRWMEKGVILRSRAQGMFLPTASDQQLALAAYRQFLQDDLPLTV